MTQLANDNQFITGSILYGLTGLASPEISQIVTHPASLTLVEVHQITTIIAMICASVGIVGKLVIGLIEQLRKNKRLRFEQEQWDGKDRRKDTNQDRG